jgi:dihydrofolate reductase
MRKVVATEFISLDGVTQSPNLWQFDHYDQDMREHMATRLAGLDAVLLGRVTYQEWAPHWPNATEEPFASFINHTPKYVVSRSLDHVAWGGSDSVQLLRGDLKAAIADLKAQPGQNIGVEGSPGLVRSLLAHDLLDELQLQMHPVVAGKGARLFPADSDLKRMKLVDSKITRTGVTILTYPPRRA